MSVHQPLYPHRPVIRRLQVLLREVEWLLLEVGWWLRCRLLHMLVRVLVLVLLVLLLVLLRLLLLVGHVHNGGRRRVTLQHFSACQVRLAWMLRMRGKRGGTDRCTMQVIVAKVTAVVLVLGLGLLLVLHGPVSVPSRWPPSCGRAARSGTGY